MSRREDSRERTSLDDVTPELFRTDVGNRHRLAPDAQKVARSLARRSARSGGLSPLGYNLTISHRHRFLWFRVAKVATRTLFSHFARNDVRLDVEHAMRLRYPTTVFEDYFKFAFVRHPLDRFISAWRNKVVDHNYFGFDEATLARMQQIEAFAHWTAEHDLADLSSADHHLALQTRLIDLSQVDYLGRLESFDEDFAAICTQIEVPASPPEARNRSTPHGLVLGTGSAELESLVAQMYRRDFQVLGY